MRITLLLLDRGFYGVQVIRDLIERKSPFIMAASKCGKKTHDAGKAHRNVYVGSPQQSRWTAYALRSPREGHVDFDLAVVCHNTRDQRGRHRCETLWHATWGIKHRPLSWIRQTYRDRFGMEASYRQVYQARIRTSSRNPVLRLLFVGVALVLRNVWVWLHVEVLAQPRRSARQLRPQSLRFAHLLLWLVLEVAKHYCLLRQVAVYRDVYARAQVFGIIFNYCTWS